MKNVCIIFLLSIIISLTAFGFSDTQKREQALLSGQYLRIHIRADSNDLEAQSVKYKVRDALVEYLTPFVAKYEEQKDAVNGVERQLSALENIATQTLQENGFLYNATAEITKERFPTRVYEGYTLPAGEYTALIIRLGKGEGDNWWCVVYPPLCFTACTGENVIYKSKIKELIEKWQAT